MIRDGNTRQRLRSEEFIRPAVVLAAFLVLTGCQTGQRRLSVDEESRGKSEKITAEAYSFNARLRKEGKPTSFKLEVYQTDTILGLSGRGYLGKGALRGWIRSDSIKVYFPSTQELLLENLDSLAGTRECPLALSGVNLLSIFSGLPDSVLDETDIDVVADYDNPERPRFQIRPKQNNCLWQIDLEYDRQNPGFRIKKFEFDDGKETHLKGTRDRYRSEAKVPLERFRARPPADAVQLSL